MHKINLKTNNHTELLDITIQIQAIVSKSGFKDGICVIFCPHTTAGLTINENADPDVGKDILTSLNKLIPKKGDYLHSEGNSDGHIKAALFGSSLNIFVQSGKLALGTWQGVYFCENDGPRQREVWVKILKEQ